MFAFLRKIEKIWLPNILVKKQLLYLIKPEKLVFGVIYLGVLKTLRKKFQLKSQRLILRQESNK
jgi:hypothetical protein